MAMVLELAGGDERIVRAESGKAARAVKSGGRGGVRGARVGCANLKVDMTCGLAEVERGAPASPASLPVRTTAPEDRAHAVRDEHGLVPAARAGVGKPRRYPACLMQGRGERVVSCETVYERTDEIRRKLLALGLAVGGASSAAEAIDADGSDVIRVRDTLADRSRQRPAISMHALRKQLARAGENIGSLRGWRRVADQMLEMERAMSAEAENRERTRWEAEDVAVVAVRTARTVRAG